MKKGNNKKDDSKAVIYQAKSGAIELRGDFSHETVWANRMQMALIFDVNPQAISKHIQNIYNEKELERNSTSSKMELVQKEAGRQVRRNVDIYNLDIIIAVGYRINSIVGTKFRQWATKTLKEHIVKGYTINEKRLLEAREKFYELQTAINFLGEKAKKQLLSGQEKEILSLLSSYAKTLTILDEYDKGKIKEIKGTKSKFILSYENCISVVSELKKELLIKGEAGELFGQERGGSFEGVIRGLYQTFGGKELYPTIEDKASHILYLIIKDHPFGDGNKRSGAFLFVYFLDKSNYLYRTTGEKKISDNALTALALLVAESDPKEKDVMIKIIKNLITN